MKIERLRRMATEKKTLSTSKRNASIFFDYAIAREFILNSIIEYTKFINIKALKQKLLFAYRLRRDSSWIWRRNMPQTDARTFAPLENASD
jgi:hypothetical protein